MSTHLPTKYQEFIHLSRYAKWNNDDQRRETWDETVSRYIDYFRSRSDIDESVLTELYDSITQTKVMPSMRALMSAGKALDRDQVAGFNCSYLSIDHPRAFDEMMYILMNGTGVGFSVERQYINKLPEIAEEFFDSQTIISVADSRIGWASSFKQLISLLYSGSIPKWDMSKIRKAGEPLKTFGGRASGPEPLDELFNFTVNLFKNAKGRKLSSIECHDLCCKIADIVVVGGVRRSALISLSNLSDDRMRHAKSGQWWTDNVQRALANNSVAYTEQPSVETFMREWVSLIESKSGERGLFNREAANKLIPERRKEFGYNDWGTNPCSEIILRSCQFCNLTEVVIRPDDTLETLKEKVKLAAILGTLQATLTDFRYLRPIWKRNTEEEALLGVSLTGIMDHSILSDMHSPHTLNIWLGELKKVAVDTNKKWAAKLGINQASAVTAVKPSGTVSQLVNSASGIHARFSKYFIRTVRSDKKDPLAKMMVDAGFPVEDDVTKPDTGYIFSFPMKSPDDAITVNQIDAISQLELWKIYQLMWCEHKPSITVYVKDDEWLKVGAWVYDNFDIMSGVSFLPYSDHTYKQAPYQEIDIDTYNQLMEEMPTDINWSDLGEYEKEDYTTASHELACVAGVCEL